jgi:hypothetical protein
MWRVVSENLVGQMRIPWPSRVAVYAVTTPVAFTVYANSSPAAELRGISERRDICGDFPGLIANAGDMGRQVHAAEGGQRYLTKRIHNLVVLLSDCE